MRAELADTGITASRKRIAHLMRHNQLQGVSRRRNWCVATELNQRLRPAPDLVERKFVASDVNQRWVADMTYVPTREGQQIRNCGHSKTANTGHRRIDNQHRA